MNTDNKISKLPVSFRKTVSEPGRFLYDSPKEKRVILGEDAQQELNSKLVSLVPGDAVTAEYYLYRRYVRFSGVYERVDTLHRCLVVSGRRIPLGELRNVYREDWL